MDIGRGEEYFAFVCVPEHHTYQNAKTNREFVVNYPGPELIEKVSASSQHAENVDKITLAGLTAIPSLGVKPPRIKECRVHLECKLMDVMDLDTASIILGKIVARSANKEVSFERRRAKGNMKLLLKHPLLAYVYPDHYAKLHVAEEFLFPENYKP